MSSSSVTTGAPKRARPRIGFLGVGWIGRHRMEAVAKCGAAEIAAVCDPSEEMAAVALEVAPKASVEPDLDALLDSDIDGVVIATPSALHARQSIQALERGASVFCQKPLGRTAAEVRAVVDAARSADRLLGVDMSYRFTEAMNRVRDVVRAGEIGHVFAVDLVFHNAYGPDKPWFHDPRLSGGGCVMDLGVHLVDLALWVLDFPEVGEVRSKLQARGALLGADPDQVEDHAVATLELGQGGVARLACSWHLHAGRDASIEVAFYGTEGGVAMRNVGGSFYDFVAERYSGTERQVLAEPPDAWGGRAAADWATRLAVGERYNPSVERLVEVAAVLDRIYGREEAQQGGGSTASGRLPFRQR